MELYFLSFLFKSIAISAIILVIFLFNALFGRAFSAKLRYTVWLVVLIGLILPLPPVINGGIFTVSLPDLTAKFSAPAKAQYSVSEDSAAGNVLNSNPAIGKINFPHGLFFGRSFSPFMVCMFLWGVTALAVFTYHIRRHINFMRAIRRWGAAVNDEKILSIFKTIQAEKRLEHKNISLLVCGFVSSSMLTGFLHPSILLPEKNFNADELELIFRHEFTHYMRRDLLVKFLFVVTISIYWFNPLIFWMYELMQADGEASCDEAVLHNSGKENRHFYAETIIGMIERKKTASTILSTCFIYKGKLSLKKRLDSILEPTLKMKWLAIPVLSIVLALTLLSGSVFAVQELSASAVSPAFSALPESALSLKGIMEIALEKSGGGAVEEVHLEQINGKSFYELIIRTNDKAYEIEINPET
ncbi:MAG: hypothetical protein LBH16_02775 [Treponema sp.]|jgi:beta-lactamase regulating signal transducer with metallopeptidase domain|nr:hypothetical protein [Treponema sp.]